MTGARAGRALLSAASIGVLLSLTSPLALVTPPARASAAAVVTAGLVAHGGAGSVAAGRRQVADRVAALRHAERALAAARSRTHALAVSTEITVEHYDAAQAELVQAVASQRAAAVVATAARARVASEVAAVDDLAAAAYESGGAPTLDAILTPDGAATLVARVGALAAISGRQHERLEQLAAARVYAGTVQGQADATATRATDAQRVAGRAATVAREAVATQRTTDVALHHRAGRLTALLGAARRSLSADQEQHLVALRRRAAARDARRDATAPVAASPAAPTSSAPVAGSSGTTGSSGSGDPSGSPGSGGVPAPGSTAGTISAATGAAAVTAAESQIGRPYVWGAAGPDSFDCSGLTQWAYARVGVLLVHYTGSQWNEGAHLSRSQLRPGDLVFFATDTSDPSTIHHVGMYIGGDRMVEAPYTGADVRISSALRSDYIGAVRPYAA